VTRCRIRAEVVVAASSIEKNRRYLGLAIDELCVLVIGDLHVLSGAEGLERLLGVLDRATRDTACGQEADAELRLDDAERVEMCHEARPADA